MVVPTKESCHALPLSDAKLYVYSVCIAYSDVTFHVVLVLDYTPDKVHLQAKLQTVEHLTAVHKP